ncbi:hypothetical protein [Rhizobium fabae]|uniref:Asparagine N-glycosylation enzyme membrane subunit Stt3 n=1 Tax=Rhizobium fabae TaxID=573179 RepID=A0A7W6BDZ3_9HYPH|nr:hypothetical protein [Rhizobium fabae]MBB3917399.1 asparagine N-glycosylation enzyme membrane subunit Stt3 [Rhizobium fabae]RUM10146.1 hypothetical protein EFB14_25415 [Rhizobium fabae]
MQDWFGYLMSYFYMAFHNAVFFMATVRNDLSLLDDRLFGAIVFAVVSVILLLLIALVRAWRRLRQSESVIRSLNNELAQVTQDLNVERVWRLAGGDSAERLTPDSLTELYKVLSEHQNGASHMA